MRTDTHVNTKAFTLIELSIVLVIIGLIVGGVVMGRSLIRSSELKSVTTDILQYKAAIESFRAKYNEFPGDMADATRYWGTNPGCGTPGTAGTGTQTCNGNGNDHIGANTAAAEAPEMFLVWQHLSDAGFITGQYSGIYDGYFHHIVGSNCPKSRLSDTAGYGIYYVAAVPSGWFPANYKHVLFFGTQQTDYEPYDPALTPSEQQSLDNKIDDGLPAYGVLMSSYGAGTCITTNVATTAVYNTTNNLKACRIIYQLGF